jgi:Fe-S oxidoreductase
MAGSFGLEAEHADISMQMAELDLLPALRAAPEDATIVACGFSCRHQIREGAARNPVHVASLLRDALRESIFIRASEQNTAVKSPLVNEGETS